MDAASFGRQCLLRDIDRRTITSHEVAVAASLQEGSKSFFSDHLDSRAGDPRSHLKVIISSSQQDATNSGVWQHSKIMTHLVRSVVSLENLCTFGNDLDWALWCTDGSKWARHNSVPDLQVVRHEGGLSAKALHDKQLKSVGVP